MSKNRGFTIEFPATARLLFSGLGSGLVINPKPADHEYTIVAGVQGCAKCKKGILDPVHSAETGTSSDPINVPENRVIDENGNADDKWFAFWEEDCMSPPIWIVRAESFEQAYEDFYSAIPQPLDENTLADYERDADGYYNDLTMTDRGWISTESIQGREIELMEVTCG